MLCRRRARAALDPERLGDRGKLIRGVPCLLLGHGVGHLRLVSLWRSGKAKGIGGLAIFWLLCSACRRRGCQCRRRPLALGVKITLNGRTDRGQHRSKLYDTTIFAW